jgi:hypothetical protein
VSEDRHNPLPHIALLTIAPKSAYRDTAFLSTRTTAELEEPWFGDVGNDGVLALLCFAFGYGWIA